MAESNKTERATHKKRMDERRKGNAFQSREVTAIATLIIGFILLSKLGSFIMQQVKGLYLTELGRMSGMYDLSINVCLQIMRESMLVFFLSAIPITVAVGATGILMSGMQTRFIFSTELLHFKLSKISFLQGMKRIMSLRSLVELAKSVMKIGVIIWIIYGSVKSLLIVTPDILNTSVDSNLSFMLDRIMSIVYKICLIFVAIAILDYAYQKYDYEKKMMMTKQEVKDEYKQTEGDPLIKGKIRERQRRISMNRMIQMVPDADVIVRNPTHYAVALKYDLKKDAAPIVLAKGQDFMAKRIIAIAEKNHILITENKPLARSLYEKVEVNSYIPAELYQAVAELMAWVYSTREKGKKIV